MNIPHNISKSILIFFAMGCLVLGGYIRVIADDTNPTAQPSTRVSERLFVLKVLPLLKVKCFGCHGNDTKDLRGKFDIRSRAGLLKGGESGEPSIVPGQPQESPLYRAVLWEDSEMPPKENDRLSPQETEQIKRRTPIF